MAQPVRQSIKRLKIDKANTTMVAVIAGAAFVVIFSLVTSKVLLSQFAYQNRVISAKRTAVNQLKNDVGAVSNLISSYKAFVSTPQNILGGNPTGTGKNDGNNATIVLDALPSRYDFPGLTSSLENVLSNQGFNIDSISGTDEQLTEQADQISSNPTPQQMPFTVTIDGPYSAIQNAVSILQHSIRPIVITNISLDGTDSDVTANISAYTFYQPEKSFTISSEVVK